jgi:ferredoxin-NADP reductase
VRVSEAHGNFVFDENDKSAVFLSGGIGITPLRSMIQYVCDKKLPNKITLLYSNRTIEEIAFKTEFDDLAKTNQNFKIIYTVTDSGETWKGISKRIDAEIINEYSNVKNDVYYVCGPQVMVDAMVKILNSLSIPKERIKFENFMGYK